MTFDKWMKEVDWQTMFIVGLVSADLADQTWRDWFNDGYMPREAALEALENEGYAMSKGFGWR